MKKLAHHFKSKLLDCESTPIAQDSLAGTIGASRLSPEPLPEAAHREFHPARQPTTSTDIQREASLGCARGSAKPKANLMRRKSNTHFIKSIPHDAVHVCQLFLLFLQVAFRLLQFAFQPLNIPFWTLDPQIDALFRSGLIFPECFRHENQYEYGPQPID